MYVYVWETDPGGGERNLYLLRRDYFSPLKITFYAKMVEVIILDYYKGGLQLKKGGKLL